MPRGRPRLSVAPCRFCQKEFKRKEHLRRHERTHTREKPFACHDCALRFSRQDLLARHLRLTHATSVGVEDGSPMLPSDRSIEKDITTSPGSPEARASLFLPSLDDTSLCGSADSNHRLAVADSVLTMPERYPNLDDEITPETLGCIDLNSSRLSSGNPDTVNHVPQITQHPTQHSEDIDSFDWLWANQESNSHYLPTTFLTSDSADMPGTMEGTQLLMDSHNSAWLGSDMISISGINVEFRWPQVQPPLPSQSHNHTSTSGRVSIEDAAMEELIDPINPRQSSLGQSQSVSGTGIIPPVCPWRISKIAYDEMKMSLLAKSNVLPQGFCLPSRHTISRYLEGFFRGFHEHIPFLHLPSVRVTSLPEELLLAMAALGSVYKFESKTGYKLYFTAKSLVLKKLQGNLMDQPASPDQGANFGLGSLHSAELPGTASQDPDNRPLYSAEKRLRMIQTLISLIALSSWGHGSLVSDSLSLASQLAILVKAAGVSRPDAMPSNLSWDNWIRREEYRRSILVAYTLLNMQSVAFNTPPILPSQDVHLCLPHPAPLWKASTEAEWVKMRASFTHCERSFRLALSDLLSGHGILEPTQLSLFGIFILVHGLIQQIFVERQAANIRKPGSSLGDDILVSLDNALRAWQDCWSKLLESWSDPVVASGPLAFNATSLLRIAYIRLAIDLGPYRSVMTRQASSLAKSIFEIPVAVFQRSSQTDLAVLQCIHALGILVRAGIACVSRTHPQNWTIIHSISNMECACFLTFWLQYIAHIAQEQGMSALLEQEQRMLGMITSIVNETSFVDELSGELDTLARIRKLAVFVMSLWGGAIHGNHIFTIVQTISDSLAIASEALANQLDSY